ncbi:unnamed protein product [Lymnaea stagnalis]|uniref:Carbonic anhydrase n=1 Tax=Lymnaea stagnalis TaxID=6523 RepID=A0AAV2IQ56_LYMST
MAVEKRTLTFAVASFLVHLTLAFTPLHGTVPLGGHLTSPSGALLCPLAGEDFSYKRASGKGPYDWAKISPCCGGKRQSPRDIWGITQCVSQSTWLRYNSTRRVTGHVFNNGKHPEIHFKSPATAYLSGAPSTAGQYVLSNIHIHFKSPLAKGSEHALSGKLFDAEAHLVHYKAEYRSVREAVLHQDGLVVIAIFLEKVKASDFREGNVEIIRLINSLGTLKGIGEEHQIPHQVSLDRLLPTSQDYYTYEGSLTTPPCSESVRWIVFRNPVYIHSLQLKTLSRLESDDGGLMSDTSNYRPLQTGNTEVQRNFGCGVSDVVAG